MHLSSITWLHDTINAVGYCFHCNDDDDAVTGSNVILTLRCKLFLRYIFPPSFYLNRRRRVGCAGSSLARHCSTSIQESIHNVWIAAGVVDSMAWLGGLGK